MLLIRSQAPTPPSAHNPAVPAWLNAIVLCALAKQPEARFASVADLVQALELGERRPPREDKRMAATEVAIAAGEAEQTLRRG